jgi:predicted amidophosphoribosyltransferase
VNVLSRYARVGLDLVLPEHCAGCSGRAGDEPFRHRICAGCRAELDFFDEVVGDLGAVASAGAAVPVISLGDYSGVLRQLILGYKERGQTAVRHELGDRLAELVSGYLDPARPLVLVPVPSSSASRRARGHAPVPALARVAASGLRRRGWTASAVDWLRPTRQLADQSELSAAGRRANLDGGFGVRRRPAGVSQCDIDLLLVDDIVTTGATAREAVRALSAAGRPPRAVATLAHTARRIDVG